MCESLERWPWYVTITLTQTIQQQWTQFLPCAFHRKPQIGQQCPISYYAKLKPSTFSSPSAPVYCNPSIRKDESKLSLSQLIRVMVAVNKRRVYRHMAVAHKLQTAASANVINNDSAGYCNLNNDHVGCAMVNWYAKL